MEPDVAWRGLPRSLEDRAPAILILSDGRIFTGRAMGADGEAIGEVVFNTGMTGYQEVLTDPSYRGQVVTFTTAHIGNYGVNPHDGESTRIQAVGAIVHEVARRWSNHRATMGFEAWLIAEGTVGICEVDTRSLTRHLREQGVTAGMIVHGADVEDAPKFLSKLKARAAYEAMDFVADVACDEPLRVHVEGDPFQQELCFQSWEGPGSMPEDGLHVVVVDFGVKHNILRHLLSRGVTVTLVPRQVDDETLSALAPDGVLFSNGPGDPAKMKPLLERVRAISLQYPTLGICLGHQLLASAFGGETYKLEYGHRGPNQPVLVQSDKRVLMTSQNHGFALRRESFPSCLEITEVNLNDGTIAAFRHRQRPIAAVQYHPEAGPGPGDAAHVFDEFLARIKREGGVGAGK